MLPGFDYRARADRGGVLIVVMGVVLILGIALAAILSLTTHEHRILSRTAAWNAALPAAEAGIEEAMSHLRQVNGGPRNVNGWTNKDGVFVMTRDLGSSRYVVGISFANAPSIISVGEAWSPTAGRYLQRRIQVTTKGQGLFNKAIMANDKITLSGQFTTDSYDSSDPAFSTGGKYDAAKKKDNGDLGTNRNQSDAMTISGQVKIYGRVATGPAGDVQQSGQIAVGTANWIDAGNTGIQSGHHTKDMNVSFPDAVIPYSGGSLPGGGTVGGVAYAYILDSGDYRLSTLSMSGSSSMLIRGNARLVIDQDVSLSGDAFIRINTNASLQVFVKKGAVNLSGTGIANLTGNASRFSLHGLPEMKDINLSGDGALVGSIYAPQAKFSVSGGSGFLDFTGAAIVNEVSGSGYYRFHYDEALNSGAKNLVVSSWKEI